MGTMLPAVRSVSEQQALVLKHYKLAGKFVSARSHWLGGLAPSDQYQTALLGVVNAARLWDPARGAFSTYAYLWMRSVFGRLLGSHGRARQVEEVLVGLFGAQETPFDGSLVDPLQPDVCETTSARLDVVPLLRVLKPRELAAVRARWGLDGGKPLRFEEIGALLGITRQGAALMVGRALWKMRTAAGVN